MNRLEVLGEHRAVQRVCGNRLVAAHVNVQHFVPGCANGSPEPGERALDDSGRGVARAPSRHHSLRRLVSVRTRPGVWEYPGAWRARTADFHHDTIVSAAAILTRDTPIVASDTRTRPSRVFYYFLSWSRLSPSTERPSRRNGAAQTQIAHGPPPASLRVLG